MRASHEYFNKTQLTRLVGRVCGSCRVLTSLLAGVFPPAVARVVLLFPSPRRRRFPCNTHTRTHTHARARARIVSEQQVTSDAVYRDAPSCFCSRELRWQRCLNLETTIPSNGVLLQTLGKVRAPNKVRVCASSHQPRLQLDSRDSARSRSLHIVPTNGKQQVASSTHQEQSGGGGLSCPGGGRPAGETWSPGTIPPPSTTPLPRIGTDEV